MFAKAKAVDRKGQSGTRLKDSIWNLSIFVTSKKRFKSKTFQHFPAPSSFRGRGRGRNKGHSFGSKAPQSKKRGISRANKNFKKKGK